MAHPRADTCNDEEIKTEHVNLAIKNLLENRKGRYESHLAGFSSAEEKICINLAKIDRIEKPQSKDFVAACELSALRADLISPQRRKDAKG